MASLKVVNIDGEEPLDRQLATTRLANQRAWEAPRFQRLKYMIGFARINDDEIARLIFGQQCRLRT
jgi:hypothetical protein